MTSMPLSSLFWQGWLAPPQPSLIGRLRHRNRWVGLYTKRLPMAQQTFYRRRGLSTTGLVVGGAIVVVAIAAALIGGGGGGGDKIQIETDLFEVRAGTFTITIPASGELIAREQVELRSSLDGKATIMEIIDEGTPVETGAVLVLLDDKDVIERIDAAEEAVVIAQNKVETRTADLAIEEKSRESSLAKSGVSIDQSKLALLAWQEGDDVSRRNQLVLAVRTTTKDFKRLEVKYKKSLELRSRDFISQNDLEQDEIDMIRAEASLSKALLDKDVYEKYTFEKDKQRMESNLKQAQDELIRVETRTTASVRSARSNLDAAKSNLDSKKERLLKYQEQLEGCTVVAPAPGMVVYGTTLGGGGRDRQEPFRVGSTISRNELLIVLPNTEYMLADVKVNEALSGNVKNEQAATIRMDAFPEKILNGEVVSVGVLAEGGGWRDPNRREYSVSLSIENIDSLALKPSMRCKAEILVGEVENVLYVPVQAVHRLGRTTMVYTLQGSMYQPTTVTLGQASDLFVEIIEGLTPGDRVLLRDPPPGTAIELATSK
jgi:HlyD family secretion protein